MKTIKVVAAVIFRKSESGKKEILAPKEVTGNSKTGGNFPGEKSRKGKPLSRLLPVK